MNRVHRITRAIHTGSYVFSDTVLGRKKILINTVNSKMVICPHYLIILKQESYCMCRLF
jgi:hypothetical protein